MLIADLTSGRFITAYQTGSLPAIALLGMTFDDAFAASAPLFVACFIAAIAAMITMRRPLGGSRLGVFVSALLVGLASVLVMVPMNLLSYAILQAFGYGDPFDPDSAASRTPMNPGMLTLVFATIAIVVGFLGERLLKRRAGGSVHESRMRNA
jgi:hypothetical protein